MKRCIQQPKPTKTINNRCTSRSPRHLPPPAARGKPPPQTLPNKHRTIARCPHNKWLFCNRCASYVSTRTRALRYCTAAEYCSRLYQLKSPRCLDPAVSIFLLIEFCPLRLLEVVFLRGRAGLFFVFWLIFEKNIYTEYVFFIFYFFLLQKLYYF